MPRSMNTIRRNYLASQTRTVTSIWSSWAFSALSLSSSPMRRFWVSYQLLTSCSTRSLNHLLSNSNNKVNRVLMVILLIHQIANRLQEHRLKDNRNLCSSHLNLSSSHNKDNRHNSNHSHSSNLNSLILKFKWHSCKSSTLILCSYSPQFSSDYLLLLRSIMEMNKLKNSLATFSYS